MYVNFLSEDLENKQNNIYYKYNKCSCWFLSISCPPKIFLSAIFLYNESFLQIVSNYSFSSLIHVIRSQPTAPSILPHKAKKTLNTCQYHFSTVIVQIQIYKDISIDIIVISSHKSSKSQKNLYKNKHFLLICTWSGHMKAKRGWKG